MTHQEALEKVRKLLRLATSSNANEAALAAARAQEIMDKFQIEQAGMELDSGTEEPEEPIINFATKDAPLDEVTSRIVWKASLAVKVAVANACKIYSARKYKNGQNLTNLEIIGRPSDVDTVRYMYGYLKNEIERLAKIEGAGCGATWQNNFKLGAAAKIGERMAENKRKMYEEMRAEASGVNREHALVRMNNAIARVEKRRADVDVWTRQNMRLGRAGRASARFNGSAYEAGKKAGASINLGGNKTAIGRATLAIGSGK